MICGFILLFCRLPCYSVDGVLWCTKIINFNEVHWPFFHILIMPLVSYPKNHCQIQYHEGFLLCFLLWVFVLLALMFKSLICFELNFIYGVKVIVQLHFSHVNIKFSQHLLLKRLCFPHWMILAGFSKIIWPYMGQFISGLSSILLVYISLCQYHTVTGLILFSYRFPDLF